MEQRNRQHGQDDASAAQAVRPHASSAARINQTSEPDKPARASTIPQSTAPSAPDSKEEQPRVESSASGQSGADQSGADQSGAGHSGVGGSDSGHSDSGHSAFGHASAEPSRSGEVRSGQHGHFRANQEQPDSEQQGKPTTTRRDVMGKGMKLAFVTPVVVSFFASEAMGAGSQLSCYPMGHACPGAEPCCSGSCIANQCT